MLKSRNEPSKGTLNSELMQRLDNMDDDKDFNPYQAIKKTTIDTAELFDDANYENGDEEQEPVHTKVKIVLLGSLIGLVVLSLMGGLMWWFIQLNN